MSNSKFSESKTHSRHNYLNTQKSNAHTKVNKQLVQLWFGSVVKPILSSVYGVNDAVIKGIDKKIETKIGFTAKKSISIIPKILLSGFLLGGASLTYAAPHIAATDGSAVCAMCSPTDWDIDNGTPDVSDKDQAAAVGTAGGGTAWDSASLPLPPNGHTTWLSLRDLGPGLEEEIVSTDMTGLVAGNSYKVTLHTLTSTGPYSTNYNDSFKYKVGSYPTQEVTPLTQESWATNEFVFVAQNETEHLQLLPGNDAPEGYQSVQVSVTLDAIIVLPVGIDDGFSVNQDSNLSGDLFADNGSGVEQPGDESTGSTEVTSFDVNSVNSGTVVVQPEGTFSYDPVVGFIGTDTFTYTITDSNGNTDSATVTINVVDTGTPTVAVSTGVTDLKAGETATITFTLSESSHNFDVADVDVVGGTLSNFAGSGTDYTATFTPTTDSTDAASISVASNKFSDAASNDNVDGADADNSVSMNVDTVVPTISIATDDADLSMGQAATITFTLSEASTDFDATDVDVSGGTLSNFAGSGTTYIATFTPTVNSTDPASISVGSNKFNDAAGNENIDGADTDNTVSMNVDTVTPTIAITADDADLSIGQTANITFTLSEVSTNFDASDIEVVGGTLSNFTGSGTNYTATFTPTPGNTDPASITVASNTFTDAAGNENIDGADADNTVTMTIDTVVPTIAVSTDNADLSVGETATITFTLSQDSTDFDATGIDVTGGTLSNFAGSGTDYTATFTPAVNSTGTANVSVASNKFSNTSGNENVDGADADNSISMSIDTVVPTIVITTDNTDLSINETATLSFTLSEPSTNFDATDVDVTGGTLSNFTGSGTDYTAVFTPTVGNTDPASINVTSDKFADAAGNENTDGADTDNNLSINIDTVVPTIVITTDETELAVGETVTVTFTLSEISTDFDVTDIDVVGGTLSNFAASGTDYTATFTSTIGSTDSASVTVTSNKFTDAAGNENTDGADADNTVSMSVDTVVPTIVITSDKEGLAIGETATITFTLSEASTDFDQTDIEVQGGTLSNFSGSGAVYTATFTPTEDSSDPATISVASNTFEDTAGNENTDGADADNTLNINIDTQAPELTANDVGPVSDTTPILTGTTDQPDGNEVTIKDDDGTELCTAIVASGAWNCESTVALPFEINNLTAETTDTAGNTTTVPFTAEVELDTDNDGISDSLDLDDDNDGIPDLVEQDGDISRDTDGDGVIDSLDLDSDNDGILDILEAGGSDSDGDGMVDDATDTDNDGLADVVDNNPETADTPIDSTEALAITTLPVPDSEGGTVRDFQDVDSDNDGISDLLEGGLDPEVVDTNSDGMIDTTPDSNDDGVAEGVLPNGIATVANPATTDQPIQDTDNDGVPDYHDLDSDNDGLLDILEAGGTDIDGNGISDTPDTLIDPATMPDSNGNGIQDPLEPNNPNLPAAIDADGNGVIDPSQAADADGDGIADVIDGSSEFETSPLVDTDADGIADVFDIDDDNDGITDVVEQAGNPARDTDDDGILDSLDLDADNDGILDIIEAGGTDTNSNGVVDDATDTDNDGLADVVDVHPNTADAPIDTATGLVASSLPTVDTDIDGKPDFQDVDSDNDGISDLVEGGTDPAFDTDNDGAIDFSVDSPVDINGIATNTPSITPDRDNDGIPDYRDLDSDNDGLNDVVEAGGEDTNADGIVDTPNTLVDSTTIPDEDNNGLLDPLEPNNPDLPVNLDTDGNGVIDDTTDTDRDGVPDVVDGNPNGFGDEADNDRDGIIDAIDLDDDNDGIPDTVEAATARNNGDTDGDGIKDIFDTDADGDGINDLYESGQPETLLATLDTNNDGVIDTSVGANGLSNDLESDDTPTATVLNPRDTDSDGQPNFQDIDSDGDSVPDSLEGENLGVSGQEPDTDNDGAPDYLDFDSDNDGIPDVVESSATGVDSDNDGIDDAFDMDTNPGFDGDGDGVNNDALPDIDNDGSPDMRDLDSDKDGLPDTIEADVSHLDTDFDGIDDTYDVDATNGTDANSDGVDDNAIPDTDGDTTPDFREKDSDADGIPDSFEGDATGTDTDNDGIDDHFDVDVTGGVDNDGDGIDDVVRPTDTDRDGKPDYRDLDSDRDGILDSVEADVTATDEDNDGIDDLYDVDVTGGDDLNGDGIDDGVSPTNTDTDLAPDYRDLDADNDTIPDVTEAGNQDDNFDGLHDNGGTTSTTLPNVDGDSLPDYRDVDSDNDGENDINEAGSGGFDTNNDGMIDDIGDSDNDGIPNVMDGEVGQFGTSTDSDNDGVANSIDLDDDNDGIPDIAELDASGVDVDTDGDGMADRLDRDSDNDGIPDTIEATIDSVNRDANLDGLVDGFTDQNNDGLHDSVLPSYTPVNTDLADQPDFRDLDSDNDTLSDHLEASGGIALDPNADGVIDAFVDADLDGLADSVDPDMFGRILINPDFDKDGKRNFRDQDSDNDELSDILEAGNSALNPAGQDTNGNGSPNFLDASGELETAVTGKAGNFGIFGLFMLLLLGLRKRLGNGVKGVKGLSRFLPMMLLAVVMMSSSNEVIADGISQRVTDTDSSSMEEAFESNLYGGVGGVYSHVDPEGEANGWRTSKDGDYDAGYQLFAGYHFKPNWFAELAYTDMGEAELANRIDPRLGKESISYKVPSLHLGYLLRDHDKELNIYGKAGVSVIRNKASARRVPFKRQTSTQLSGGAGVQYQPKETNWFARAGVDVHDRDAVALGLSLGYKFKPTKLEVEEESFPIIATTPVAAPKPVRVAQPRPKPVPRPRKSIDTDGDGFIDSIDDCIHSRRNVVVDGKGCEVKLAKPVFNYVLRGVNFHTNSARLTSGSMHILDDVANTLRQHPQVRVQIVGHTDDQGKRSYNQGLSERRAASVVSYVVSQGVSSHRISSAGKGESQPITTNSTALGRGTNRRVEIREVK